MSAIGVKWQIAVVLMYANKGEKRIDKKNLIVYDSHTADKTDLEYG